MGYKITIRGSITTLYYQHPPNPISKTFPNGMKFNVLLRFTSKAVRLYHRPGFHRDFFHEGHLCKLIRYIQNQNGVSDELISMTK